jgi:hypothetical protein
MGDVPEAAAAGPLAVLVDPSPDAPRFRDQQPLCRAAGSRAAGSAQTAYRSYADQVREAFRKGLAGEKTTASDVKGSGNAILNV